MSEHSKPPKSEFEEKLLSDDNKWWEFLDPNTYEVKSNLPSPTRASSTLIDWSKKRETSRSGPIGFGFFNRCGRCGNPCPPDHTFCVHCGGEPRAPETINTYAVVIKELEDQSARDVAAELLVTGGFGPNMGEITKMLDQLPLVFTVHERKSRIAATLAKLAEVGVYGNSFSVTDASIPWLSETAESIARDPKQLMLFGGITAFTVFLAYAWSLGALIFGGLAVAGLFWRRLQWYHDRYSFDVNPMLDVLAGFDSIKPAAIDLLSRIKDKDFRGNLTICLMEYYSLHQQFSAYEREYGDVLLRSDDALRDLVEQVLRVSGRFADLEFHIGNTEPADLQQRIAEAEQELETASGEDANFLRKSIEHLRDELAQYSELLQLRGHFQTRIATIARSMEGLRERVATMQRAQRISWEEIPMEAILRELDEELGIFEETVQALS